MTIGSSFNYPADIAREHRQKKRNANKNWRASFPNPPDLCFDYRMLVEQDNIIDEQELLSCEQLTVRIRYRSRPIPCRVKRLNDGRLLVHFLAEASAITPGQSAVFYDGARVLGGAFIASQRGIGLVLAENQ